RKGSQSQAFRLKEIGHRPPPCAGQPRGPILWPECCMATLDLSSSAATIGESASFRTGVRSVPASFDDIAMGQVVSLGEILVEPAALEAFIAAFAPGWPLERGAPDAMVYALWCRLDAASALEWPQTK